MSYNPQNPNGQATSANSSPVVVASDQSAVPISAASLPLPSTAATSTKQSDGSQKTQVVDGSGNVIGATSNALDVNIKSNAATNQSVNLAQVAGSTVATGGVTGSQAVGGPTASGSTLSASPVTTGSLAKTALPTAVSDAQVVNNMADKFGRQIVLPNAQRDLLGTQTTTISNTTETTIVTAASSIFNDLSTVMVSNTSSSGVRVDIRDTTGGSVIFQFYVPAGDVRGMSLTTPWPQTTVNTNWTAQASATVSDIRISAMFVKNK